MSLNYAEVWSPELLEIYRQQSLISPFIKPNVKWLSAKTFHFTQMSTSGYKAHSRAGGWNSGTFAQQDNEYTVAHDRDIQFLVDKADVDETNATASIENISKVFLTTKGVPEANALFFSKVATVAKSLASSGYSLTARSDYNKTTVYGKLKTILKKNKLRRYRAMGQGALICYVCSGIMDALEMSVDFTRKIEMTQIADGGIGLETRVTDIDGIPVIEVIDEDVFYDKFDFASDDGGYVPVAHTDTVTGSRKINVLVASPYAAAFVPKVESIYYFAPGSHTNGDGYLYQNRSLSDAFVFPNGLDNKIDSVFVDLDTDEYGLLDTIIATSTAAEKGETTKTVITVSSALSDFTNDFYYKSGASSVTAPTYGDSVGKTWTKLTLSSGAEKITLNGTDTKIRIAEATAYGEITGVSEELTVTYGEAN